jgi:hypothetical protein
LKEWEDGWCGNEINNLNEIKIDEVESNKGELIRKWKIGNLIESK